MTSGWTSRRGEGRPGSGSTSSTSSPGARTAWHRHAEGQTLHVTEGVGLVQARGGEVIDIRPGETIYTPPGEGHWHGATPDHFMTHLAIWESSRREAPSRSPGATTSPTTEYGSR